MNVALSSVWSIASDHAAPRRASLRLAPGCGYAERVWSMQVSGTEGRMSFRSTEHHRPNQPFNRSAKKRRFLVPVALRAPAPG